MRKIDQAILFLAHLRRRTVFTGHDLVETFGWNGPNVEQKARDVIKILVRYGFVEKVGTDLKGRACYFTTEDGGEVMKSSSQNEDEPATSEPEQNKE